LVLQPTDVAEDYLGLSDIWACYRDHKGECQRSAGRHIVQGNIENVFVADSQGQKYNAIFVDEEWLVFIVPRGDRNFTLHFLDFSALELW